jgi:hypothetical protein
MHYSPAAFAMDKSIPTLVPLHPAKNMGQREGKLHFVIPGFYYGNFVIGSNGDC